MIKRRHPSSQEIYGIYNDEKHTPPKWLQDLIHSKRRMFNPSENKENKNIQKHLEEQDVKMLKILKNYSTIKDALPELDMTSRAVYNRLYRLRLIQVEARKFINVLLGYRRGSSLLAKVLTPRIKLKGEKTL